MEEKIFYQSGNVKVTESRIQIGAKMFLIRNIASVEPYKIEKSRAFPIWMIIIGVVFLFSNWILGCVVILFGILIYSTIKDEYTICINNNASENENIRGSLKDIKEIVNAINEAVIYLGS